jgi:DNA-binding SARP family transcriptional activator/tetratricopeptide (TPR) repeat protein
VYEFSLLGPLEVRSNGRTLELGGQKQRVLLAMLLLEANRVVSSDRLIEAIWEGQPSATAQKGLQVLVSQVRKLLGRERVQSRAPGYALTVEPDELDVDRFLRLRAEGRLVEALALWHGPPLADLAYHRFAQAEIARLEELRLATLEDRIDDDLARGLHAELVGELEALTREHRSRERLLGQLLLALYRSGRQADALEAYQSARRSLVEELGIEPGQQLRLLQQQILRQDPALGLPLEVARGRDARGPFVGRTGELAELTAAFEDAAAGQGRLVLLEGEPGIGKSYLADEFIWRTRQRGAVVLAGRCWEAGGAPAYWPWVQSLRSLASTSDWQVPDLEEPGAGVSEASRFPLFEAVSSFLRRAAEERPMVLFLDDLQAADPSSLLLLEFVTRELLSMRLLLVGAYRNVDPIPSEGLVSAMTRLEREQMTSVIRLHGLSGEEVAEYVALTASDLTSPELAGELEEKTEGNPLFVAEMMRLLSVEGGARTTVPQSVQSVIVRRLAHLSEDCRGVLVLASVVGREFSPALLAELSGTSETDVLHLLDEAMQSRAVSGVPDTPGRLRFTHVLIRDALYEGVTAARRIGLHRRVVDALEALYGQSSGQHFTELAHHALAGSDFERALLYARRGGDRALALLAYEEAVRLYELALDALSLSTDDEAMRCELLLALGDARTRAGDTAAKSAFLDAAEIARRLGAPRALARAAVGYGGRIVWVRAGGDERLVPLLEEALRVLGDADPDLRTLLLARLAGALRDEPSRERRDALTKEAVELARATGNPSSLAYALGARGHAIAAPDTVHELLSLGGELCETARAIGDRERAAAGHAVRTLAALILGDFRAAEQEVAANNLLADELKQAPQLWDGASTRALLALNAGRFAEAAELDQRAFAVGEHALPDAAIPIHVLHEYAVCDFRGGLDTMEPAVRGLAERYPARVVFRCVLVHLLARVGKLSEAERELGELAEAGFAAVPFDQEWLFGMSLLAESAVLVGDAEAGAMLYELLLPWGRMNAVDQAEGMRGSVARYLGLLALLVGRRDDAVSHFETALEANERMGLLPWIARTQEDYAHVLRASPERADITRGRALLDQALATYSELGMEASTQPLAHSPATSRRRKTRRR